MFDFKFLNENKDTRPKTRDEVIVIIRDNLNILYDGPNYSEDYLNGIVDIVCANLYIN